MIEVQSYDKRNEMNMSMSTANRNSSSKKKWTATDRHSGRPMLRLFVWPIRISFIIRTQLPTNTVDYYQWWLCVYSWRVGNFIVSSCSRSFWLWRREQIQNWFRISAHSFIHYTDPTTKMGNRSLKSIITDFHWPFDGGDVWRGREVKKRKTHN